MLDRKDCVYQAFYFKNEIKEMMYSGDGFSTFAKDMDAEDRFVLALGMMSDKEAFMPGLKQKIEEILGEGNFINDYWEFGDDDFSMYWFIRQDVYLEKMKLIEEWVKFEELEELVFFSIKDLNKKDLN